MLHTCILHRWQSAFLSVALWHTRCWGGRYIYIKVPPPPPPPKKKASAHIYVYMSIHHIFITKYIYNLQQNCHGHFHAQLKENGGVLSAPVQPIRWNYNNASGVGRKYRVQRPTKVVSPLPRGGYGGGHPSRSARGYGGAL